MLLKELIVSLENESLLELYVKEILLFKGTKNQFQRIHNKVLPNVIDVSIKSMSTRLIKVNTMDFPCISITLNHMINFKTNDKKTNIARTV